MQYANTVPLPSRRKPILIKYIKWDQTEDHGWRHIWTHDINKSSKSNDYKILYRRLCFLLQRSGHAHMELPVSHSIARISVVSGINMNLHL